MWDVDSLQNPPRIAGERKCRLSGQPRQPFSIAFATSTVAEAASAPRAVREGRRRLRAVPSAVKHVSRDRIFRALAVGSERAPAL